jgi:hypothetical protein
LCAGGGERLGAQHRASAVDDGCNVQVFMGIAPPIPSRVI